MGQRLNGYKSVAPIEFLKSKMGREATLNEILLLDYLLDTYKFSPGILNMLIEQVLKLNNHKFSRGFTIKVANEWSEQRITSLIKAEEYAKKEYEKFLQLQKRDNFGEIRELTVKEKEIVNRIYYKSSLNEEILDLVISYCMKINDGYIISWFINRSVEFLENHHVENRVDAQALLHKFHQKYVLNFGRETYVDS